MFSKKDIIVLGMMIFALFLGAGNIIFPPMEGYSAGNHWATASLGFVITGVLMPFITLVVDILNTYWYSRLYNFLGRGVLKPYFI